MSISKIQDAGVSLTGAALPAGSITSSQLTGDAVPLGVGQTWQDVTGSRSSGVTYTNSTGKPIFLSIYSSSADGTYTITVDGIVAVRDREVNVDITHITIVPNSSTYLVSLAGTITWNELR